MYINCTCKSTVLSFLKTYVEKTRFRFINKKIFVTSLSRGVRQLEPHDREGVVKVASAVTHTLNRKEAVFFYYCNYVSCIKRTLYCVHLYVQETPRFCLKLFRNCLGAFKLFENAMPLNSTYTVVLLSCRKFSLFQATIAFTVDAVKHFLRNSQSRS